MVGASIVGGGGWRGTMLEAGRLVDASIVGRQSLLLQGRRTSLQNAPRESSRNIFKASLQNESALMSQSCAVPADEGAASKMQGKAYVRQVVIQTPPPVYRTSASGKASKTGLPG